jgi:hypothetical protein
MKKVLHHDCFLCGVRKHMKWLWHVPLYPKTKRGIFVLLRAKCWLKPNWQKRVVQEFEAEETS